jgi:hypothetical protein
MSTSGFATVNPSTGAELETFSFFSPAQTEEVLAQADKRFFDHIQMAKAQHAVLLTEKVPHSLETLADRARVQSLGRIG